MNSRNLLSAAVSAALLASAPAMAADDSGRSFEIYGFAQADYIQDISGRLDPDWDDAFRPRRSASTARAARMARPASASSRAASA
jgi:hypothetical protein